MNECLHKTIFYFIILLLILYASSLSCEVMIIVNNEEYNLSNSELYLFWGNIIISAIVFIFTLLFGLGSIYFLSKEKLLYYKLTLFLMLFTQIGFFIYLCEKIFKLESQITMKIIFVLDVIEIILDFISIILCCKERKGLLKEIKESPLNYIDEYITEDMYNNILSQSQNPNDLELKKNFLKFIKEKKKKSP